MADFIKLKHENPNMRQSEKSNQLSLPSSTLQRYRNDINMLSPYRINTININKLTKKASNTKFNNNSHCEPDVKIPRMTSSDLKSTQTKSKRKTKIF